MYLLPFDPLDPTNDYALWCGTTDQCGWGDDSGYGNRWDEFVMNGKGVRCVSDQPWVTAAETCEFVVALLAAGDRRRAIELFEWTQNHRTTDGSYYTGLIDPGAVPFPEGERSSYTAAAVILAADALDGSNPTSTLFTVHG